MSDQRNNTVDYGLLNPSLNNDGEKRKYDPTMDNPFAIVARTAWAKEYGTLSRGPNDTWEAIVLRVDRFEDGECEFWGRIPELDAATEPVEFIDADIDSFSHPIIELHRLYRGTLPTRPSIREVIEVIPTSYDPSVPGKIVKSTGKNVGLPIKSTKIAGNTRASLNSPQTSGRVPSVGGDQLGSGIRNPASQLARGGGAS